jgi:hypothetical protein
MSVLLKSSNTFTAPEDYKFWIAVTGTPNLADQNQKLPSLEKKLEDAFVSERETWWELGQKLSGDVGGDIAHMPTAGAFGSDFGIMLAWARLVYNLAEDEEVTLVVCDDPWLFRHLAKINGVNATKPPMLVKQILCFSIRGFFARCRVAFRNAKAAFLFSSRPQIMTSGETAIVVYGHPDSNTNGFDAYFGDLMVKHRTLKRLLHTDCTIRQANHLLTDGRTMSLHAWGNPWFAMLLLFCCWRPSEHHLSGVYGWLVRRAVAIENSGGGPAMNRWQAHCQKRWLEATKPSCIAWPWENHGWERNLCRSALKREVKTIGYQHSVIGPHQFNYAIYSNYDGLLSIPNVVVADGPAYYNEMMAWGIPAVRLMIGGSFRFPRFNDDLYDPQGPVFVPLSAVLGAARAQLDVAHTLAGKGRRVLIKPHPMYSISFKESKNLILAKRPLAEQQGLSAVLYTTGASGLETVLMGIPGYRLILDDRVAIDVLPKGFTTQTVTVTNAAEAIFEGMADNSPAAWDDIFSDPNIGLWKSLLFGDNDNPDQSIEEFC